MLVRSFLLFILTVSLASCAALGIKRGVPEDRVNNLGRIAVVSALEDTFHHIHIGTTIFSNEATTSSVPQWHLKEFAAQKANQLLQSRHQSAVLSVPYTYDGGNYDNYFKQVAATARAQGYTTAVVILPVGYDNAKFLEPGYGHEIHKRFNLENQCVYAQTSLYVIDTATADVLGWEWGFDAMNDGPCVKGLEMPLKMSMSGYSRVEQQQLYQGIRAKLDSGISHALTELGLL